MHTVLTELACKVQNAKLWFVEYLNFAAKPCRDRRPRRSDNWRNRRDGIRFTREGSFRHSQGSCHIPREGGYIASERGGRLFRMGKHL